MIALDSTWSTVVMLLVAGGVGLIGGIGAGLLEMRRTAAANSEKLGTAKPPCPHEESKWSGFWSSVFLGGVAAVAILYFFPPTQEVVTVAPSGETATQTSYELTKLVGLALIVGSAGAAFLQMMQTRALALESAGQAKGATDTGVATLGSVPVQTGTTVKPTASALLMEAGMKAKQANRVAGEIADSVEESMKPFVKKQQQVVVAAGTGEPSEAQEINS